VDPRPGIRLGLLAYALAGLGQGLHWWDLNKLVQNTPDLCVFHRITGLDCPGCGMTRSLILLVQGRWGESWTMHPFGILFVAWMLVWALLPDAALRAVQDRRNRPARALTLVLLAALLVRWAVHLRAL
jgi:hypothetical protein